jgi:hypothetical protein
MWRFFAVLGLCCAGIAVAATPGWGNTLFGQYVTGMLVGIACGLLQGPWFWR